MNAKVFVDTNVLVYARDANEPIKRPKALEWLQYLWRSERGRLSFQVLKEYYVTVTSKLRPPMEPRLAQTHVRSLLAWNPLVTDVAVLGQAWDLQEQHLLSWWDALIVASASLGGCRVLLTEDLQDGQRFSHLQVVNPFRHDPPRLDARPSTSVPK